MFLMNQRLYLGFACESIPAELLNGQMLLNVGRHIINDTVIDFILFPTDAGFTSGKRLRNITVPAQQMQQKKLQIQMNELLTACRDVTFFKKLCLVGVIQPAVKGFSRSGDDLCQQTAFLRVDGEQPAPEKVHGRGRAEKRNDYQIGSHLQVGTKGMKFSRLVKNNVTPLQGKGTVTCGHGELSFIDAQKFPEVVGFSGKGKIALIFKIMHRDDFTDADGVGQKIAFVGHKGSPVSVRFLLLSQYNTNSPEKIEK